MYDPPCIQINKMKTSVIFLASVILATSTVAQNQNQVTVPETSVHTENVLYASNTFKPGLFLHKQHFCAQSLEADCQKKGDRGEVLGKNCKNRYTRYSCTADSSSGVSCKENLPKGCYLVQKKHYGSG